MLTIVFLLQDLSNLPCFKTSSIFLILHETFNGSREAIHRTEQILRSNGAFKTFHIVSDPLSIVTFDIFGNMLANLPALVFSDRFFDLSGYHYKVHYATMEPYSSVYDNEGIDISVAKVVVQHQNATVEFVKDLGSFEDMRSVLERYSAGSVDFSIVRTLLSEKMSKVQVYLPQWEQLCVTVPKRHTRPLLIQLVRPFRLELWIFIVFYTGVRTTRKLKRIFKHGLVLVLFLIVDFCLMESYIAKVMCYLINMRYDSDPKTMQDLDRRGETFAVLEAENELLDRYHGLKLVQLRSKKKWHFYLYSNIVYCKVAEYFNHEKSNFDPDTNDKLATILNERLMLYPAFYSFAGGHPLSGRFQLVLERMFDAGIWAKIYNRWTSDLKQFEAYLSGMKNVISFGDMHSLWIMLVGGYLIGVACFAVEKMFKR